MKKNIKKIILLTLLLTTALAASLSTPSQIQVNENTTFTISTYGAQPGNTITLNWTNPKIHALPGNVQLNQPNIVTNIHIITEEGACGKTNLTFHLGTQKQTTTLNLGDCMAMTSEINPDQSMLGEEMWELRDEIRLLEEYLQMTPQIENYIDYLNQRIDEVNSIDITESQDAFIRKDQLTHQVKGEIKKLEQAFTGVNPDMRAPVITKKSEKLAKPSKTNITQKVREKIGNVQTLPHAYYYKKKIKAEVTKENQKMDYTLFEIRVYNPKNTPQKIMLAENKPAATAEPEPITQQDLTIWNLTIQPKQMKTIKYGVYENVKTPVRTLIFQKKEKEPPQETETPETQPEKNETIDTCKDGVWNAGEKGIDCGGPCPNPCPEPEEPPPETETQPEKNQTKRTNALQWIMNLFKPSNQTKPKKPSNQTSFSQNYLALLKFILPQ